MPTSTPGGPASTNPSDLPGLFAWCRRQASPFNAFNECVLGRGSYWSAQREICRALMEPTVTTVAVPAGHSVGKSFSGAGVMLAWLAMHEDSLVISTAPSQTQLSSVLWKEVRRAVGRSPLKRFGRLTKNPERYQIAEGWYALGQSTTRPENLAGHHTHGPILNVVDEASGVEDADIWATLKSLKPTKTLLLGNPLRPDGPFFEACERAGRDPAVRLIRIPSTASPDIDVPRSDRGLADALWLEEAKADWGEDSLVYKVRVLAQFPGSAEDELIPAEWLELAGRAIHVRAGPTRLAIDLGGGNAGDKTVLIVRDDNGVLDLLYSNTWGLEDAAKRAARLCKAWAVEPRRVSFDAEGIGHDFRVRLEAVGIKGARPYKGGFSGGANFGNLRSATGWALRKRLNPTRMTRTDGGLLVRQHPFAIRTDHLALMRRELRGLRYRLDSHSKTCLEEKKNLTARLKHSPDFADCLTQSFAFPNS